MMMWQPCNWSRSHTILITNLKLLSWYNLEWKSLPFGEKIQVLETFSNSLKKVRLDLYHSHKTRCLKYEKVVDKSFKWCVQVSSPTTFQLYLIPFWIYVILYIGQEISRTTRSQQQFLTNNNSTNIHLQVHNICTTRSRTTISTHGQLQVYKKFNNISSNL